LNNEECDVIVGGGQINAGTYPAGTAFAQSLANPNYTLTGAENINAPQFVINKAKPDIKILTTAITINVPTVIQISGNNDNATVRYTLVNGSGEATLEGGIIIGTKLGEVYLTVQVPETANYLFGSASAIILVEKPGAPVELENTETEYGTDLTLTVINSDDEGGEVSIELKDGTTLATLKNNVLTPTGVGEVIVVITVAATDTYKETVKEVTVTIVPRPIVVTWSMPEEGFTYDQTEYKPTATITNLVGDDECSFEVTGAINAGTDCVASVHDLSNENYTIVNGTDVQTTFTIKPRPVTLDWEENMVYPYDGQEHAPNATVNNALEGDVVNITNVQGAKDAGTHTATALATDNSNYTCEGSNTTTFTIEVHVIDDPTAIIWGSLELVYNGKVNVPVVEIINEFGDELYAEVSGDGIHVREEKYTATIVGILDNTNYVLSDDILNNEELTKRLYSIVPATVEFEEEVLKKQYSGEFQQPEFTVKLLGEDDDLTVEVDGGGINVSTYSVSLSLSGASAGDYKLAYKDEFKQFEITKKEVTVTATSKDINEKYTGSAIDIASWINWYETSLNGLLDADAGKQVSEVFAVDTLQFTPKIYEAVATVALFAEGDETPSNELTEVVDKGEYIIVPQYVRGWLTGSNNYTLKGVLSEDGTLIVGGKVYLEIKEESSYRFIYERVNDYGFRYFSTYEEENMVHGVDDLDFDCYVLGLVEAETNLNYFLSNIADLSMLKLYTHENVLAFANGQPTSGFEALMESDLVHIGTGWRIEYGDEDAPDIVYVAVRGDLDGDGLIGTNDTRLVSSYIARTIDFNVVLRLAAMISNTGAISATDLSVISGIISQHNAEGNS
ncbi:MAG: hypothetical protein K2K80_03680, partial [Clostridia bacterium]|nr:hypothetical protein [Clostridia bacterium]